MNSLIKLLELYPDKPWDWFELSKNPNITWELVQAHPDKPWSWYGLSYNPNITWEIVQSHPDKTWQWYGLSKNPNITWDIVQAHPDKPWDWIALSSNKFLKDKIALKNYNKKMKDKRTLNRILKNDNRLYTEINSVINRYF